MTLSSLDHALAALPSAYPGPGGAAAVIKNGEVVGRHSWGFANAETRQPFTPQTLFRMCSITKQFTCALLDEFSDKAKLDAIIASYLPNLREPPPEIMDLAHNQSGLRDYWAVAMLHGAPTESAFGPIEAHRVISGTRSLHFRPGTAYSYVNQNFFLISEALEAFSGRSFAELLRTQIFEHYGMNTAFLAADTRAMPDGTQGYEGSEATGYRAAINHIFWTGDAGLGASLDDMIAWELAIDAQRDNPQGFYNRLSAPVTFRDGTPARYGHGLQRGTLFGRAMTGHGGALRGWRSHRLHLAEERLSVVVMFNHMSEAHSAAAHLAAAALDIAPVSQEENPGNRAVLGHYLDKETGLSASVTPSASGTKLSLRYAYPPETLDLWTQNGAGREATRLSLSDEGLLMERPQENRSVALTCIPDRPGQDDIAGQYHCAELDSVLSLEGTNNALYGAFSGMLGLGRMERLQPLGEDVWLIPCLRALDHSPPGYWTLAFVRNEHRKLTGVRVGCWLARDLFYRRSPE